MYLSANEKGHAGRPKAPDARPGLGNDDKHCGYECTILYMTTKLGFHKAFQSGFYFDRQKTTE